MYIFCSLSHDSLVQTGQTTPLEASTFHEDSESVLRIANRALARALEGLEARAKFSQLGHLLLVGAIM